MYRTTSGINRGKIIFSRPATVPGSGLSLGEEGCDQPVHYSERDAIRAELKEWTGEFYATHRGQHMHEGHPDIRAYLEDIIPRMEGLVNRPKLLRCSAEARDRAQRWIANCNALLKATKKNLPGWGHATIVPPGGINMPLYRGRTYHIRGPFFNQKFQTYHVEGGRYKEGDPVEKPPAKDPGGAPGTVLQEKPAEGGGELYLPGGATPTSGGNGAPSSSGGGGAGGGSVLPPEIKGALDSFMTGEIYGVPKSYLVYGALGLVAYNFIFKKRR